MSMFLLFTVRSMMFIGISLPTDELSKHYAHIIFDVFRLIINFDDNRKINVREWEKK